MNVRGRAAGGNWGQAPWAGISSNIPPKGPDPNSRLTPISKSIAWKTDCLSNPSPKKKIAEIWPEWPAEGHPLGVIVLAKGVVNVDKLGELVRDSLASRTVT